MRNWKALALAGMVVGLLGVHARAEGGRRVATIDLGAIVRGHPKTEINTAILQKQVDEFEAENREMIQKRSGMLEELEALHEESQDKALSEAAREKKVATTREKYLALKEFEKRIRENAQLRRQQVADQKERMREVILTEVGGLVAAYAKENGIDLVLDASAVSVSGIQMIVFGGAGLDITETIADQMAGKADGAKADDAKDGDEAGE